MQNENYYRNELEIKMQEFIDAETNDAHPFGYISDELNVRMAEAAMSVLKQNSEINDFLEKEGYFK